MRLTRARQGAVERLLWSRDSRVVARLSEHLPEARVIELADSGWCVIASAERLTEDLVARVAGHLPLLFDAPQLEAQVVPLLAPSELRRILAEADLGDIDLVGVETFPGVEDVVETGVTFVETARLKALP